MGGPSLPEAAASDPDPRAPFLPKKVNFDDDGRARLPVGLHCRACTVKLLAASRARQSREADDFAKEHCRLHRPSDHGRLSSRGESIGTDLAPK